MKGKHALSQNQEPYKMEMQRKGIRLGDTAFKPTPMTANPVYNCDPGLGAKTIAHPFKKGKPQI